MFLFDDYLLSVHNIDATLHGLACQLTTVEGVVATLRLQSVGTQTADTRHLIVKSDGKHTSGARSLQIGAERPTRSFCFCST